MALDSVNTISRTSQRSATTNKLIANTYTLLAMTLFFSAGVATLAMYVQMPPMSPILYLVGYFGLFFLTNALRNSIWGLLSVFGLTGFMGLTLGPIVSLYLKLANGPQIVTMALVGTAAIFLGLSGYALTARRDFSFMGGFLMVGMLVAMLAGIGAMVFSLPMLSLGVSAMFILLMAGFILFQTSMLVNGQETNYIMATVSLYVSIFNLFVSLLNILGSLSGGSRN
jgi:modulator of FtsH protease